MMQEYTVHKENKNPITTVCNLKFRKKNICYTFLKDAFVPGTICFELFFIGRRK